MEDRLDTQQLELLDAELARNPSLSSAIDETRFHEAQASYRQSSGVDSYTDWWENEAHKHFTEDEMRIHALVNGWSSPDGATLWPPHNGNLGGISTPTELQPGANIDRYGAETGSFLSPAGTPFEERALRPGTNQLDLNEYTVEKPIPVNEGEAAPWFGEPGGGVQYEINWQQLALREGVTMDTITNFTGGRIAWLIEKEYLTRL